MLVMKFGGSSVASQTQIAKVCAIVKQRASKGRVVVVSSAHKGMTNALIAAAERARCGDYAAGPVIDKQRAIAASLGCPDDLLEELFQELSDLLRGISLVRDVSPRSLDYISSFGERMSVRCIADYCRRQGLATVAHDVWDLGFITNAEFNQARPLPGYETNMAEAFAPLFDQGQIPVVTGFIGKTPEGEVTTVGRNGSDLTATLVAAALGATEAEIWTDTDGVMTADPGVVKGARNIPQMSFDEAAELAYFGSRVLHPSTLLPAIEKHIPVRVLNTNRPEHPGTVIRDVVQRGREGVTSIAYKEGQAALTILSTRMFGQSGFLSKVFEIIGRHGVIVDMLATSEVSVSLTVSDACDLEACLPELQSLGECQLRKQKTILAVVGQCLAKTPGIGRRVLGAMAEAQVNVEMVSYAIGSINFSMLVDDGDVDRAVSTLHTVLFE